MASDGQPPQPSQPVHGERLQGTYTYVIGKRLGKGGFGSVYQGTCQDGLPKTVAIKIMDKDADRGRLKRELSALLAVRHPRIPEVYDWSVDGTWPFVAMRYYPLGNLRHAIRDFGAFDEDRTLDLLEDLLGALTAAHNASLVHLDVKPGNVLVDDKGRFALTDFGVSQGARTTGAELPTIGLGTPGYHAPEQRDRRIGAFDMRTDLYGLGATVWAACTGIDVGSKRAEPLRARRGDRHGLPEIHDFRPGLSSELRNLVMALLYEEPEHRPGSAAEVLQRVRRLSGATGSFRLKDGSEVSEEEAQEVFSRLMDPLWAYVFRKGSRRSVFRYDDGQMLCRQGESSHRAFILLSGKVKVLREGKVLHTETREGTFLGEVSALTGRRRTASLQAEGPVYVRALNASQLESFVTANAAVGVRLVRSMAERLVRSG